MSQKTDPVEGQPAAIEVALKYPFTSAAGVRIERICLRRAKRADLRAANQFSRDEVDQETFLFARLSGLTMEDLDNLDMEDNDEMVRRFRQQHGKSAS